MKPHQAPAAPVLGWLAFWLAIAFFFASRSIQRSEGAGGDARSWLVAVGWNLASFLLWAALSFLVEALRRRYPLDGSQRRNLYLHAVAGIFVVVLHLCLLSLVLATADRLFVAARFEHGVSATLPVFFHLDLAIYWLVALGGEALAYGRRVREQQLAASRLEQQLAEARLSALRMQLHPHFLFNTLNSIAELLHVDLGAAERMTLRLSGLLRTALQTTSHHLVPLREELEFLERYLDVEKVRFQDRLAVSIDIDPEVAETPVPALVLQPLVENAVRHGVGRLPAGGRIAVRAAATETGTLVLEVENDAPASSAAPAGGGGVGLANTAARLQQLFGGEARFVCGFVAGASAYRVHIELPRRARSPMSSQWAGPATGRDLLLTEDAPGIVP